MKAMQVGKTAPREKGSDEKLVEVFGRQIGSWAGATRWQDKDH